MDEVPSIGAAAEALHRAAVDAVPGWVRRSARRIADAQGIAWTADAATQLDDAASRAQEFVHARLGALLATDIDCQTSTPLSIFRDAVRFPVEVLHALGARPAQQRGDVARWAFPNDPFGITPANLLDIGPEVHRTGMIWGATKAGLHLQRRRQEGLR